MRGVFALLLCVLMVPFVGCGGEADTSHREDPDFVDTAEDPTAIMPSGVAPGGTAEKP